MQQHDTCVWAQIAGYEGQYEISSDGSVRSVSRIVRCGYGKTRKVQGAEVAKRKDDHGYARVDLYSGNARKSFLVHRLVASAFVVKTDETHNVVNHKDGDPSNNAAENLEWCTQSDNCIHSARVLLRKVKPVIAICPETKRIVAMYTSAKEASTKTGFGFKGISRCANGERKTYKGFVWSFA